MGKEKLPLRERKKISAMRHIQTTALRMFVETGFDHVTVEQIADASDVSPSTVYRYFGAKEGLVMKDEFDAQILTALGELLADSSQSLLGAVKTALGLVMDEHFVRDRERTLIRTKLWMSSPSLQASTYRILDEVINAGVQMITESGRLPRADAQVFVAAIVHALIATVINWYEDGALSPFVDYVDHTWEVLVGQFSQA